MLQVAGKAQQREGSGSALTQEIKQFKGSIQQFNSQKNSHNAQKFKHPKSYNLSTHKP